MYIFGQSLQGAWTADLIIILFWNQNSHSCKLALISLVAKALQYFASARHGEVMSSKSCRGKPSTWCSALYIDALTWPRWFVASVKAKDVKKSCTYCRYVRCETLIVRLEGKPWFLTGETHYHLTVILLGGVLNSPPLFLWKTRECAKFKKKCFDLATLLSSISSWQLIFVIIFFAYIRKT